ncbi:trypsin delta-like [Teleopsis dalmanni]|uniref:trypsin delta-like n=1 Tax=Teleopsis dalmanni TaxID=139649 RepID=UPI0018CED97B|nr:trypsin delta-like [Teleopsis dalmanni]
MLWITVFVSGILFTSVLGDISSIGNLAMPDGRIVGGEPTEISKYPHQISMRYKGRHRCGGSIYTSNVIVSAAHCVVGIEATDLTIVAGTTLLSETPLAEIPVYKFIVHEKYSTLNNDNDVAILVLTDNFDYGPNIQPIGLAKNLPPTGTEITVSGWGTLEEGGTIPDQLQVVNVNLVDQAVCKKSYYILLTSRMLCAGVNDGGKDACQGDSGGPLICDNELLGIVSWGTGCARKNFPGVYASVPALYEWIEVTAAKNGRNFSFL